METSGPRIYVDVPTIDKLINWMAQLSPLIRSPFTRNGRYKERYQLIDLVLFIMRVFNACKYVSQLIVRYTICSSCHLIH